MLTELTQEVENMASQVLDGVHTALVGKVKKFNSKNCMAEIKPYGRYYTSEGEGLDYPVLVDVPVMFPYSAKAKTGVFIPVKKGDDVIIIISETELENWRTGVKPDGPLRFDLNNAIAIPGMLRKGNANLMKAYSNNAVVVASGKTRVQIDKDGISVEAEKVSVKGEMHVTGDVYCSTIHASNIK